MHTMISQLLQYVCITYVIAQTQKVKRDRGGEERESKDYSKEGKDHRIQVINVVIIIIISISPFAECQRESRLEASLCQLPPAPNYCGWKENLSVSSLLIFSVQAARHQLLKPVNACWMSSLSPTSYAATRRFQDALFLVCSYPPISTSPKATFRQDIDKLLMSQTKCHSARHSAPVASTEKVKAISDTPTIAGSYTTTITTATTTTVIVTALLEGAGVVRWEGGGCLRGVLEALGKVTQVGEAVGPANLVAAYVIVVAKEGARKIARAGGMIGQNCYERQKPKRQQDET
eukprot:TRINITY_DN2906_c0_g1_i3.p1 TRINITY_DN2906_c0_g1~~TRINITY_DN2906_c0_g1_i3.p1  ORF type:complete len:290 (-),score=25.81 TRINITY_DN2906_c0_g1_i3:63-932(-)